MYRFGDNDAVLGQYMYLDEGSGASGPPRLRDDRKRIRPKRGKCRRVLVLAYTPTNPKIPLNLSKTPNSKLPLMRRCKFMSAWLELEC